MTNSMPPNKDSYLTMEKGRLIFPESLEYSTPLYESPLEFVERANLWLPENEFFTHEDKELWIPKKKWEPLYYTKPALPLTRGDEVINFVEQFILPEKGFREKEKYRLTDWQKWVIRMAYEEKLDGTLRFRKFIVGIARKNGKSDLAKGLMLYHLVVSSGGEQIFSMARDKNQAEIIFNGVVAAIKKQPLLKPYLKVYRNEIVNLLNGAIYRPLSSDSASFQGFGPSFLVFDELHATSHMKEQEQWEAATQGSADRYESLLFGITTAGDRLDESLLGNLYHRIKDEHEHPDDESDFGGIWWGVGEDDDITDPEVWKKANPNIEEGLLDFNDFKGAYKDAVTFGKLDGFKRYRLNQFVSKNGDSQTNFMHPNVWDAAIDNSFTKITKGSRIWLGFDGSTTQDSTTLVAIDALGHLEIMGIWENNGTTTYVIPRQEVNKRVAELFAQYDVQKLFCDDSYFQTDVQDWMRLFGYSKVKRIPQSLARMVPAAEDFYYSFATQAITHNNNKKMKEHFMNAVKKSSGKISKETINSKKKIDVVIASVLASMAWHKDKNMDAYYASRRGSIS